MRFGFYQDIVILKQKNDEYLSESEKEYPSQLKEFVSVLDNNPMMKLIRERKEKEFREKYLEYNQWFIDRKIGGSAYDNYMENAIRNAKNNQKLLEEIGVKLQIRHCIPV